MGGWINIFALVILLFTGTGAHKHFTNSFEDGPRHAAEFSQSISNTDTEVEPEKQIFANCPMSCGLVAESTIMFAPLHRESFSPDGEATSKGQAPPGYERPPKQIL